MDHSGMDLVFRDVSASLGGKPILHNVSARVTKGSMLAIMGPSGTGKTTLLNTLMGRVPEHTGSILINNQPINKQHRRQMGYALQEDAFFANLTLRQTLKYTALLVLPESMAFKDKLQKWEAIAETLDLTPNLDTEIGAVFQGGLSGGERKRANIACELLRDPELLLVDEPTSGLDAALALRVMKTLQSFATDEKRTVITTIHQPSSQIFHMFEKVLLLSEGQVAYYGPSAEAVSFMAGIGLHCDPMWNPADFMLEQVTHNKKNQIAMIETSRNNRHLDNWSDSNPTSQNRNDMTWPTSFWTQYKALSSRHFVRLARANIAWSRFTVELLVALVASLLYWQMPRNLEYVEDRKTLLYVTILYFSLRTSVTSCIAMPQERAVVSKERLSGTYRISAYYLAKLSSEFIATLMYPTLYWVCMYFSVGLATQPENFFLVLLSTYLLCFVSMTAGFLVGALIPDGQIAINTLSVITNINYLGGGWFQQNYQTYLGWMAYTSMLKYFYDILLQIEFTFGPPFRCTAESGNLFPDHCLFANSTVSGDQILYKTENLLPLWLDIVAIFGIILMLTLSGYWAFRCIGPPQDRTKRKMCTRFSAIKQKLTSFLRPKIDENHLNGKPKNGSNDVNIGSHLTFKNLSVTLKGKQILQDVSGSLQPGTMMAVLGPSGVGKSTLLNALSGKLGHYSGSISINNQPINKQLRKKLGYVMQEDVFLKNITLKQTLQFTARLRLPEEFSSKQRKDHVLELVNKFSLEHILNTRMEDLSGGEKKRANIASEILADPELLLVDEPTSGLDSALAYQMMKTLKSFSVENNKTVVATIHQPSSQIFHMFDTILLIADGQVAYYGSPKEVVDHFASIGLECDTMYNPADFIMEQLRVDKATTQRIIDAARFLCHGPSAGSQKNNTTGNLPEVHEKIDDMHYLSLNRKIGTVQSVKDPEKGSVQSGVLTSESAKWNTGFFTQFTTLVHRNFVEAKGRNLPAPVVIGNLVVAVLIGMTWWQISMEEMYVTDLKRLAYFMYMHWSFHYMLDAITSFPDEYDVIRKERLSGTYRLSAYWLAKMTSELPVLVFLPTITLAIYYPMCGFSSSVLHFLTILSVNLISGLLGQSLGILTAVATTDVRIAVNISDAIFWTSWMAGAFYVSKPNSNFTWLVHASYLTYPYHLMLQILFEHQESFKCAPSNQTLLDQCKQQYQNHSTFEMLDVSVSGSSILKATEENIYPVWINLSVSLCVIVLFRVAAYFVLRYFKNPSKGSIFKIRHSD